MAEYLGVGDELGRHRAGLSRADFFLVCGLIRPKHLRAI